MRIDKLKFYPSGDMLVLLQEVYINVTGSICDYFTGEIITAFCGLTILWTGIGKKIWRGKWDQVPQDF